MKISLNWLNSFVKIDDLLPQSLADKMTFAGAEIEGISTLASAKGLVIGNVLSSENHPDSDHLHVLQVDEGQKYGIHQIVCGAPNARTGLKVIVAREGAVLPEITIARSEIRGTESDGMCCALYELGVDRKYLSEKQVSGIEELPLDAPVGEENVLRYLGLDDTVFELKSLPNRPDLNAMENVAREVGALYDRKVAFPAYEAANVSASVFAVASCTFKCPQFAIREIRGVVASSSPVWLQRILSSSGIRSINNIVDIGNYVMLLTGQPLNMYDLDKLPKQELTATDEFSGDFVAMDGKRYQLQKGDLVIASGGRPVCLAGIMTSEAAAVTASTKNVVIEAAVFDGASIRHTSNRLGLVSESSSRFVKGLNPDQAERVLEIASSLLVSIGNATQVGETVNYDVLTHEKKTIATSLSYINARLGTAFPLEEVVAALRRDQMGARILKDDRLLISVPSYRIDMSGEADVSEEVIRLLGYDKIVAKLPREDLNLTGLTPAQSDKRAIRRYLRGIGLNEIITYSLVSAKAKDLFAYIDMDACHKLANPMTDDHEYVRKNLLYSLLDVAAYNAARQENDLALFEVSDIDTPSRSSTHLAIVVSGAEKLQGALTKRNYDFYAVKGLFEGIMNLLGLQENRYRILPLTDGKNEFHPWRSAEIRLGKNRVGVFGELHPEALKKFGLENAAALEIDLSAILELKTSPVKAHIPSKFPSVSRDLAFIVDKGITYEEIRKEIKAADKLITGVSVFDVYEGAGVAEGKKSMAITLTFTSEAKTLVDAEVNAAVDKAIGVLKMRFAAEIRR
jgi:phenylalanyl-tRNA synthetase beta chain